MDAQNRRFAPACRSGLSELQYDSVGSGRVVCRSEKRKVGGPAPSPKHKIQSTLTWANASYSCLGWAWVSDRYSSRVVISHRGLSHVDCTPKSSARGANRCG